MNLRQAKALIPWRLKLGAKVALSRLPLGYGLWQRLQLFRHGQMTELGYAERVFAGHVDLIPPPTDGHAPVLLELGPGDSLLNLLLGYRRGAAHIWLVDAGKFAVDDAAFYSKAAATLGIGVGPWRTMAEMCAACRGSYLTEGLASLRSLPTASVDFIWSQAVLEHVRLADFENTARELRRVLRPEGRMSHQIDFRDHLGGRLNSLRFSPARWEGPLFSESGFYTNRLRLGEVVQCFEAAGFAVEVRTPTIWPALPTPRAVMDSAFRTLPDSDLLVSDAHLVMQPR
ncbi:MAG: class I SAM-dependent methyltransferase [Gemmatimonadales bacterium]